jgi:DNA repair protein RecN (Recombination protein N)
MLSSLYIENFAIVSHLELDFSLGMTAFTGETGAGKSIMIDALMLAMGGRADTSVVRPGSDKCEIQAHFTFDAHSEPALWLKEHELATEGLEVWLRRVISTEGRSKSYINGHPVPLQKVKEFSELLVDIHGQHQHQRLLQHTTHRLQLDEYAGHQLLLEDVQHHHRLCIQLKQQYEALAANVLHQERMDLLQYQIEELSELNIQEHEMQQLHDEHQLLHHAQTYLTQNEQMKLAFSGDDERPGICQQLHSLLQITQTLPQNNIHIKNTHELVNNALIQCDEALDEVEHFSKAIQLDPERLALVESRMSQLHLAARKYHLDAGQLLAHLTQLEQEKQQLEQRDEQLKALQLAYQLQTDAYQKSALKLRESREQHATTLSQAITETIRKLGMPKGYIEIKITPLETMQAHGFDKVEYYVCTNPGISPDALSKIASGGELSRIGLSIQLITAQKRASTPALIFDEVDVGIGGTTAALVGQLLRKLGDKLQVFCVTHQPQVASAAHHHYLVEKHIEDNKTFSHITALTETSRIQEIARMLGGITITEQTRSHARALLLENDAVV